MRAPRFAVLATLLVLLAGGCGSDGEGASDSGSPTPVIVDSDGAIDDIKAILYLLERPEFEIVAITMSGTGVAHCPRAAENASALLERIGAPDIPVACGRTTPLAGNNQAPSFWRSGADALGGVQLPEPRPLSELTSPELLVETVDSSSQPVLLVALGPLTNVAEALEIDADFFDGVESIYLMGGAVDDGGNLPFASETAEFNIWADPKAAAITFAADIPITLVPLDATNHVPVTPYLYDVMEAHRAATPSSEFLAEYLAASPLVGGLYHWDELAAVVVADESVVTIEERQLSIVETGVDQGATIESPDGRTVRVAVAADSRAFEDRFYEAIIGTSDTGVAPWEPDAVVTWDGETCTYEGVDPLPDQFFVRLDNDGNEPMAFVTGMYDAEATVADLEALTGDAPPDWWQGVGQIFAFHGAREVWAARGGPSVTGLCLVDIDRFWELAGPRLPE